MRALTERADGRSSERGAVVLWVGVLLTVALGSVALVVDVGALYHERAQLQNGADAAALAVAMSCAAGSCGAATSTAASYAAANVEDGTAAVETLCGVGPGLQACAAPPAAVAGAAGWVMVDTRTSNPGTAEPDRVGFLFAPILGGAADGATVRARSVAAWGSPGSLLTAPLVISQCEFTRLGGTIGSGSVPSGSFALEFHDNTSPCVGPGGASLPGGFGWITHPGGSCATTTTASEWVAEKPGLSAPSDCLPSSWIGRTIVLPIFVDTNGLGGSNGQYRIGGYVGFEVTGQRFPSSPNPTPGLRCPSGANACLTGRFRPVALDGTGGFAGSGSDYGTRVVRVVA